MNGFENLPNNLIDYKAAKYWNELGTKNGAAEGYNNLGWLYENGLGVVKNYTKAAELYQKAVTEGVKTGNDENNIAEARSRLENVKNKIYETKYAKKIKSNSSVKIDNDPLNIRN
jgi:TPR repeat protein